MATSPSSSTEGGGAFVVGGADGALRLDQLLARRAGLSRREARLVIGLGRVEVGGRAARIIARRVDAGAQVIWRALPKDPAPAPRAPAIIYADRHLVVVAKPAGLLAEPDRFGAPSVPCRLAAALRARGEPDRLWLVHRLDAGTSGLMVLARRPSAARGLGRAFAEGEVGKDYLALTAAAPAVGPLAAPIARVAGCRHGVRADGRPAATSFSVWARARAGALVGAAPSTGRTHQIRVHLAHLGQPILGDHLYGGVRRVAAGERGELWAVARPMLHAWRLAFAHPEDGRQVSFVAAPADDFSRLAGALDLALPKAPATSFDRPSSRPRGGRRPSAANPPPGR